MTELNTQLPTSGKLCGKSKWEVRRTRSLGDWKAWNHNAWEATYFDTWREAMDYADEQARTREVVLPRVDYGDHVIADKGLYSLHVDHREHCTDITLGGWDGVTVENRHLRTLGAYLYALGEAHQ